MELFYKDQDSSLAQVAWAPKSLPYDPLSSFPLESRVSGPWFQGNTWIVSVPNRKRFVEKCPFPFGLFSNPLFHGLSLCPTKFTVVGHEKIPFKEKAWFSSWKIEQMPFLSWNLTPWSKFHWILVDKIRNRWNLLGFHRPIAEIGGFLGPFAEKITISLRIHVGFGWKPLVFNKN